MKKFKKIPIGMLIVTILSVAIAASAVTWAWVALNRQVNANNIEMTIEVSPNLVISDNSSTIASYTSAGWADSYVTKSWSDDAEELIPVDHYDSTTYPTVTGTNTFNLVYNSNPENVSRSTGKGADLTFAHVPADGQNTYFIDKTVYIASLEQAMTKGTDYTQLTFSITEVGTGTTTNTAYKSASVDIYINGTYKNTLNLDTLSSFNVTDVNSIPLNTAEEGDSYITITLRCYFDGALQNASDNTKNYVNSVSLATNTADIAFNISIRAN